MELSYHFDSEEFKVSDMFPDLANRLVLEEIHVNNLFLLCRTILQPTRDIVKCKIRIESGFRSLELNDAVGGSITSLHLQGKAADFYTADREKLEIAFEFIQYQLPHAWCQLRWYTRRNFIHVAIPHPDKPKLLEILER